VTPNNMLARNLVSTTEPAKPSPMPAIPKPRP
jgi:hypothetical protein